MAETEYIEREALIEEAKHNKAVCQAIADIVDVKDIINNTPVADVIPIRHGHWIAEENWTPDDYYYTCSICREDFYMIVGTPSDNNYKYCPNCGARMDGNEVE